jgi:DNA-binding GntR family transcriptional regulator
VYNLNFWKNGATKLTKKNVLLHTKTTVAQSIYDHLRREIISMQLVPGERLREKNIAEKFGISRTPVREACLLLAEEHLLEVRPQSGTFVAPIRLSRIWDAQFLRIAVEVAAIRKLAASVTPETIIQLQDNLDAQLRAIARGEVDEFYAIDEKFHETILQAAGHGMVWKVINAAKAHMDRVRFMKMPLGRHMEDVFDEHQKIIRALETGLPELAENALYEHLSKLPQVVAGFVEKTPDLFVIDSELGTTSLKRK